LGLLSLEKYRIASQQQAVIERTNQMAARDYYQMKAKEVLEALNTSQKGLPRDEAERRRNKYGPNEIRTDVSVPKWLLFLLQFKEVLVVVLIVAGIISFVIGILNNSPESIRNGAVMFVIVLINAIIGFVQEYKAGKILERLRELIKSPARVMLDGELSEMTQDQLVPGDIVRLEEGDKVPADM
jgi:Ca2+-transporting ATPase